MAIYAIPKSISMLMAYSVFVVSKDPSNSPCEYAISAHLMHSVQTHISIVLQHLEFEANAVKIRQQQSRSLCDISSFDVYVNR